MWMTLHPLSSAALATFSAPRALIPNANSSFSSAASTDVYAAVLITMSGRKDANIIWTIGNSVMSHSARLTH
jgi:hypothetical protein